jgi:dihydroneopterin aldolase
LIRVERAGTVISIDGIRAVGRHGANPGEQLDPQEFLVDVEVWVEVTADSIEGTLDYRMIADRVRDTVSSTSFELLEVIAEAVATELIEYPSVLRTTVVVHKPRAAASLEVDDVSAEVTLDS